MRQVKELHAVSNELTPNGRGIFQVLGSGVNEDRFTSSV